MRIAARHQSWPLKAPFRIARSVKTVADVVVVEASQDGVTGWGEAVPYAHYGESVDQVLAQVNAIGQRIDARLCETDLAILLPPGAARNALSCALLEWRAKRDGVAVWRRLDLAAPTVCSSAQTIVIDTPTAMAAAAARHQNWPWLKMKLDRHDILPRLEAVHRAAPNARLIVDANEGWDMALLTRVEPALWDLGVRLLEQPLPAGDDQELKQFRHRVPICADESCHTATDLPRLQGLYDAVNIKLDKAGGLIAALDLLAAARQGGFAVMLGCMVASSLSIAPAMLLASEADFIDLDGALWLAEDRAGGVRYDGAQLHPPAPGFWGGL